MNLSQYLTKLEFIRDELIAYYTHLGEEASKREQKALWKIRRARLETARTELLMQDAARWQVEMEEHRQAQASANLHQLID